MTSFENRGCRQDMTSGARMACGVCWIGYDPAKGGEVRRSREQHLIAALSENCRCPNCDAPRSKFMTMTADVKQYPGGGLSADTLAGEKMFAAANRDSCGRDLAVLDGTLSRQALGLGVRRRQNAPHIRSIGRRHGLTGGPPERHP